MLVREITFNATPIELDKDLLATLINRIIKDIKEVHSIKSLIQNNIENNKQILKQLDKSVLLMEFNQEYMKKSLKEDTLTKMEMLDYYSWEDVSDEYKVLETEVIDI